MAPTEPCAECERLLHLIEIAPDIDVQIAANEAHDAHHATHREVA